MPKRVRMFYITNESNFGTSAISNQGLHPNILDIRIVATPLWPSVGVKPNTSKVGDLESFVTPECLEFDSKAENTLH